MVIDKKNLPDDPAQLKQMLFEVANKYEKELIDEKERTSFALNEIQQKYERLEEKYRYLQKLFFGKRSEKLTPEDKLQGRLFNEGETSSQESNNGPEDEKEGSGITLVKQYNRRKAGRKPIPSGIPRIEEIHDLSSEEKKCGCCGKSRPVIGKEESEELDFIPARIQVIKHIRPKYGPCSCEDFIHTGKPEVICHPAPKRMLPGSIASEGLLSYVFTSKFCDALPFYRLSKMFKRIDVDIPRATMSNWQIASFKKMNIFFDVFLEVLMKGEFIRMDETTVQVLREEGRTPESKSYMWVAMGYPARGHPLVLYQYHPSRSGDIPVKILNGFKGYLQTDGYKGYNKAVTLYNLIHVGCFAHARREFHKAYEGSKKKNKRAYKIILIIRRIYKIESELRIQNLPDDKFVEKRRKAVTPVLDELHSFLIETQQIVVPSSSLGEAVSYTLGQWDKLVRYLNKAYLTPDNNEIERSIKSFVIGRKNWMFSNTPGGAAASAGMYSLIESAKLNGLDPYKYLRFLFSKLPHISDNRDQLQKLLPCFVTQEQIKITE